MTHPLRFKPPYLPKVRQTWETDKYGLCVILERDDSTTVLQQNTPGKNILFGNKIIVINKNTKFIRRHFRDQAEREAAPAIPVVEDAIMELRNGLFKYCINKKHWKESGLEEKCQDFWFNPIAVHDWPETIIGE